MSSVLQNARQTLRTLSRNPGFSLVAISTLALAISANTAIWGLVQAVLLQPVPFEEPERLVTVWESGLTDRSSKGRVSSFNYLYWRDANDIFEQMALYGFADFTFQPEQGSPHQLTGSRVTEDFFPLLAVQAVLGRTVEPADYDPDAPDVVVLSHALWKEIFGGDRSVIGRVIELDRRPFAVVGVMPRQVLPLQASHVGRVITGPNRHHFWIPYRDVPAAHSHIFGVVARLKPGIALDQARVAMSLIGQQMEEQFPESNKGTTARVFSMSEEITGDVEAGFYLLPAGVGLVLIIACSNVAGLVLVRARSRRGEIALRAALGATRGRLFRHYLVEGGILAGAGSVVGILLAAGLLKLVPALSPGEVPRLEEAGLDFTVLCVTLAACGLCGLIFAATPLLRESGPEQWLQNTRGPESSLSPGLRQAIIGAEVSLALILVFASLLMAKSFYRLQNVNPGFEARKALTFSLSLPSDHYSEFSRVAGFFDRFLTELRSIPGVEGAAAAYDTPLRSNWTQGFRIEGRPEPTSMDKLPVGLFRTVSPGYFAALGIPVKRGRVFGSGDTGQTPGVVVINESMAARWFPGEDPLGQRLRIGTTQWMWGDRVPVRFEIIGIVADVRFEGLDKVSEPAFYLPYAQTPHHDMSVIVTTRGDPLALVPVVRSRLENLDAGLPISEVETLADLLFESVAQPRFHLILITVFASGSLFLALVGLWGVLNDILRSQTRELGIRLALGAGRWKVFSAMLFEGIKPALAGVAVGLLLAAWLSRFLQSQLFEVSATDPVAYLVTGVVVLGVTITTCLTPALRAARTDPIEALRYE